jgi:hypothetical protein
MSCERSKLLGINLAAMDFIEKYKDALRRIRGNLVETNLKGCFANSVDLTRMSDFVGFNEGVFIGEVFESVFDNFKDTVQSYEHKNEEIEPIKIELNNLINLVEEKIPSKNEKTKAELYDAMVKARACVTHLQIQFMREKKRKRVTPTIGSPFEM